jgi:hypothetical protein
MKGTPLKNLKMFQHLCGENFYGSVILTTTRWDEVPLDVASNREAELQSKFWKPMIQKGSDIARFYPSTFDSAWSLINRFNFTIRRPMKVQIEMVDERKELNETSAFKFLVQWWGKVVKKFKGILRNHDPAKSQTYSALKRGRKDKGMLQDNHS